MGPLRANPEGGGEGSVRVAWNLQKKNKEIILFIMYHIFRRFRISFFNSVRVSNMFGSPAHYGCRLPFCDKSKFQNRSRWTQRAFLSIKDHEFAGDTMLLLIELKIMLLHANGIEKIRMVALNSRREHACVARNVTMSKTCFKMIFMHLSCWKAII